MNENVRCQSSLPLTVATSATAEEAFRKILSLLLTALEYWVHCHIIFYVSDFCTRNCGRASQLISIWMDKITERNDDEGKWNALNIYG